MQNRIAFLVAAAGFAGAAFAQPFGINGTGATLLETLLRAPATTNDFLDVDGDGASAIAGSIFPDQLAPNDPAAINPPFAGSGSIFSNPHWLLTYRIVGSGNGIQELLDSGLEIAGDDVDGDGIAEVAPFGYYAAPDGDPANNSYNSSFASSSLFNRLDLTSGGMPTGLVNPNNPGGVPFRTLTDGSYLITTGTGPGTGVQVDFANADVSLAFFTIPAAPGVPSPLRLPGQAGYGANPRIPVNTDGTLTGFDNDLITIEAPINVDTAAPDAFTVFDTPFTLAPVAAIVNYGTGLREIDQSDLRHLQVTGRRLNGENLVVTTRDAGSGTRNAFMNQVGTDPSWGVGENIGDRKTLSAEDRVGPLYQPTNNGSSGRMDNTTRNTRLGVGHTGAERGVNEGLLIGANNPLDVLGIRNDLRTEDLNGNGMLDSGEDQNGNGMLDTEGTVFARPTIENVLNGGIDGYAITGVATASTIGNPRAVSAALGGFGFAPGETGTLTDPAPRNEQAAAFVNNITRSVAAFTSVPGGPDTDFTPGEFLATQFVLIASANFVAAQSPAALAAQQPVPQIANGEFNGALNAFVLGDPGNALANPVYDAFDAAGSSAGVVPDRTTGFAYSDSTAPGGSATGAFYVDQNGNPVNYLTALNFRNLIAGDFSGDAARSTADIIGMLRAFDQRFGSGAVWAAPNGTGAIAGEPGGEAVIEILGDFNCDGSFDMVDVRWFADGLTINSATGNVDRALGFTTVDNDWATVTGGADNNFFNTTIATGNAYVAGWSRADIAGSLPTVGFAPIGNDGVVDLEDVDYVVKNFGDWSDVEQAAAMDLSADMNGDLVVDAADAEFVIVTVLGVEVGDLDLDGDVDMDDAAIVDANLGTGDCYSQGDVNFDGVVDEADQAFFGGGFMGCNAADVNEDGMLSFGDVTAFIDAFNSGDADPVAVDGDASADTTGDGMISFGDVTAFINAFNSGAGCP